MAETTITVKGDSKDAVSALADASRAVEGLSEEIADASAAAERSASGLDRLATSVARTSSGATGAAQSLQRATSAIGGFQGALSTISPAAGQAAGALGSLSSASGGFMALLNPVTLGVGALTLAVGAGVKAFQASREAQRAHADALARSAAEMQTLTTQAASMAAAMDDAAGRVGRVASAYRSVAAELESMNTQRTQLDSANLIAEEEQRVKRLEAALIAEGEARYALRVQIREQERALSAASREVDIYNTRANRRQHEAAAAELARLNAEFAVQDQTVRAASAAYGEASTALDDLRTAMDRVGVTAGTVADTVATSSTSATRSVSELADAMIRASEASGDWSRVMSSLDTGGGIGRELARMLEGVDDRLLEQLGLPIERIEALYRESMSGAEALRASESALLSGIEARAEAMEAIAAAEAEAQRIAYAREQLEVDQATRRARERMEQDAWFSSISQSYSEQIAAEDELAAISLARMREGLVLTSEQRDAVEASLGRQREAIEELEQAQISLQTSLTEGFASAGLQSMVSLVGTLTTDLMNAALAGENMGEAVPKSVLKAVGSMSAQFGAMTASLALMATFTPGLQGNAAGLWGAAAGFSALAAAAGVGANFMGRRRGGDSGGGSSSSGAPSGDRTTTYIEGVDSNRYHQSGIRARTYGEDQANADRLHIDRGQSWA